MITLPNGWRMQAIVTRALALYYVELLMPQPAAVDPQVLRRRTFEAVDLVQRAAFPFLTGINVDPIDLNEVGPAILELGPSRVVVELTERYTRYDFPVICEWIDRFRERGIMVVMDDVEYWRSAETETLPLLKRAHMVKTSSLDLRVLLETPCIILERAPWRDYINLPDQVVAVQGFSWDIMAGDQLLLDHLKARSDEVVI